MNNKIDLDKFSRNRKKKATDEINLKETAKKLLELLAERTGVKLEYGSMTFTYHGGECFRVEAQTTHRLLSERLDIPAQQIKLTGKL